MRSGPSLGPSGCWPYTHRVAITNNRLLDLNGNHVSFSCADAGGTRKVMKLKVDEFIRRFLLHVLPDGFHRIRNYGLFANGHRTEKLALCRKLLDVPLRQRIGARMRTMILMRLTSPTTSDPRVHAAAAACRSLRASGDRSRAPDLQFAASFTCNLSAPRSRKWTP